MKFGMGGTQQQAAIFNTILNQTPGTTTSTQGQPTSISTVPPSTGSYVVIPIPAIPTCPPGLVPFWAGVGQPTCKPPENI
jgi:hypothetical protein